MLMRLKKRGDKMSIINENMTSKEMLGILVEKNMEDARKAKANGELVCWSSSIAPCEFTETMGICTIYPENYAAVLAAKSLLPNSLSMRKERDMPTTFAVMQEST